MKKREKKNDKRQFRRVTAPVYFTYTPLLSRPSTPVDISPGGLRMCSDEKIKVGKRIDLTMTLSDGRMIECQGQVVWVKALPPGSRAKLVGGVGFLQMTKENERIMTEYLEEYEG